MSSLIILGVGVLLALTVLVIGVLRMISWESNSRFLLEKGGKKEVSESPPPEKSSSTENTLVKKAKSLMSIKVILSTLAIIGVIMLAWVFLPDVDLSDIKETTSSIRDVAPNIPIGVIMTICVILVLILAGMGAVGKGDFVGKWAFRSLGLLLLAVVFGLILGGPGFIEAWSKFQEENAAALKGERRSSSETKGVPPISAREYFGHPVTINPKGEWSQWIQVTGDRCIWIYSVTPDQVRAKAKQADSGLEWNKYHELRQRGVHGDPGWVQIKSDVEVTYEFRPRGMC